MIGTLFPGQGSQFVGMGKDLAMEFPEARDVFLEADDVLGTGLSRLCWEGPEAELTLTVNAQPAILVHSVAVWKVVAARQPLNVAAAAGHSLGEFTAYVAAGSLDLADAVRTVRRRGELMYESGTLRPGAMSAILGLNDAAAEAVCQEATGADGVAVAANYNAPGQLVISGDVAAVRRAEELARDAGAKRVIPLNVSGAFHSPLMEVAVPGLREQLVSVELREPAFPVVSNVTASLIRDAATARDLLVRQLTSAVRWVGSVGAMRAAGIGAFLEFGPGNVLTGLLRRIDRAATGRAIGTAAELSTFLSEEG